MTRAEIALNSSRKELEKLNGQLERAKKSYEKKLATAQKYGVEAWTPDDRNEWLKTVETTESGFLVNKADEKKNGAWWDFFISKDDIADIERRIERATKEFNKLSEAYENELRQTAIDDEISMKSEIADRYLTVKLSQEEIEAMQEQMKAEWLKDGIVITKFWGSGLEGTTPQGKCFYFYLNNGITDRSWHCYTLYIDGNVMFTSGTIQSCYKDIKRR